MIKSPRLVRPHKIIIKNRVGEINGDAQFQDVTIHHVSVDQSYGIKQSQKGVQADGSTKIVIDLNDCDCKYIEPIKFERLEDTSQSFTVRPDVDLIVYENKTYTAMSVSIPTFNRCMPEFLEIVANESF